MPRKLEDHSQELHDNWRLLHRVPNPQGTHLYRVQCRECARERDLSWQRITQKNTECKNCKEIAAVRKDQGLTAIAVGGKLFLYPNKLPWDVCKTLPEADHAMFSSGQFYYGIGAVLSEAPNLLNSAAATATRGTLPATVWEPLTYKLVGDSMEIPKNCVQYFGINGETFTGEPPEPIAAWLLANPATTTYTTRESVRPDCVWVMAHTPKTSTDDLDWDDVMPPKPQPFHKLDPH